MNIFLRGGGFGNKGDEAMMLTVQRELSRRFPGANFLWKGSLPHVAKAQSHGLTTYTSLQSRLARALCLAANCIRNPHVRRASLRNLIAAEAIAQIRQIDAVIDFSGFNYSDEWGASYAKPGLAWAEYCHAANIPFICMPQAWGPFQNRDVAEATRRICKCSAAVYARDRVSMSHLKTILECDHGLVKMSPDIAFLFGNKGPGPGSDALKSLGIEIGRRPVIGVTPNIRVYERSHGEGAANDYVRYMITVVNYCIQKLGGTVVLIPHGLSLHRVPKRDDRFLCGLIEMGVSDPSWCFAIREYVSSEFVKSIESRLDLMVGSRFHGLVFALSSGVPAVAIGWSHKYRELMELVGLDDHTIDHGSLEHRRIAEQIDAVWARRDTMKEAIVERLPAIRRQVETVFDDVAELLVSRPRE